MRRLLTLIVLLTLTLPTTATAKEEPKGKSSSTSNSSKSSSANDKKDSQTETKSGSNSSTSSQSSSQGKSDQSKPESQSNNSQANANPNKPEPQGSQGQSSTGGDKGKPADTPATSKDETKAEKPGKDLELTEGESREFMVKFRDDASVASEAIALRELKAKISRIFTKIFKGLSVTLNSKQLEALQKNPRVELIEENATVTTTAVQESATWGLDRIDQRSLPLRGTFTYSATSASVRAYVIDTGVRASHQEFSGRVQPGYTAVLDGQGTNDCNGHGTHVAGTIAGSTYGVSKSISIVPVRVLGCDGSGTLSGVIAGLDWIAANHTLGTPAVANMSLGAGASSTLDSAVNNLINRGVTVVVAAGNSSASACNYSPARVPAAITIAASTNTDQLSSFSNHGSCVDLIAPGSAITSAWYTSDLASATLNGTSMASPHVAGAVATILSLGYLSPSNVDAQLKASATSNLFTALPTGTPNLLLFSNPESGTTNPPPTLTVPTAPTSVVAVAAKRAAQVSWQRSSSDGGAPISSQTIKVYSAGTLVKSQIVSGTSTTTTVKSLNPRVSYIFTVAATNSVGTSPESSASNAVTPLK